MTSPRVTVVIPVHNGERFVGQAIESVLAQSFSDFELLVINDGSTDGSAAIIQSYRDPRIRLIHLERNVGLAGVRNRGLKEARGELLAWLDADDVSLPTRLHAQVRLLDRHRDVAMCGTWVRTLGMPVEREWHYPVDPAVIRCQLLFTNPFATSSVMLRRRLVTQHGWRFDAGFPPAEDYQLWERITRRYPACNIPEVLTVYRLHAAQTSTATARQQRLAAWRVQEHLLARLGVTAGEDEKALHLSIGFFWGFDGTEAALRRAGEWLEKLQAANAVTQAFPEPAFSRVLAERWMAACLAAARGGLLAWRAFRRSPLSRSSTLPRGKRYRLLVRAMLHKSVDAGA
jgi:hypothetical protein